MAERKRWDKHQDSNPSRADHAAATSEAKADPVLTKQMQYIKVLEERNRVKKRLAAASKRNDRLHEREEAFVTAFNVPTRAAQANSSSSTSGRTNKSAAAVLPTKLAPYREQLRLNKCKSAPSTTLNCAGGDDKGADQRVRRAKWNRPQAPMNVAVEHHDGVRQFRLTTADDEEKESELKGANEDGDDEENYLEESFEEFDEEDESEQSAAPRQLTKELVIEEIEETGENELKAIGKHDTTEAMKSSTAVEAPNAQQDFSRTTNELFGLIRHLSRSKQRALVDVLQQFQCSEQDESDVKTLQSSIGDPAIWKEITSALGPSRTANTSDAPSKREAPSSIKTTTTRESTERQALPSVAPLKNLLEEQLRWEDEYANKMKEQLAQEREEKQRVLKEAEARRAKMMKELEDEERELERLMEVKRQERLAKLRALQGQVDAANNATLLTSSGAEAKESDLKAHQSFEVDDALSAAEVKYIPQPLTIEEDPQDAKPYQDLSPIVPPLKLPTRSEATATTRSVPFEIHVKLLSTWGRTRAVGLTQICVYDLNGEELSIDLENVRLYDQVNGKPLSKTNDMVRGLRRLFNGIAHTNADKDMWLGRLGDSGMLVIKLEVSSAPSKLCVWNYNSKAQTACTRDIEVLMSGKSVWTVTPLPGTNFVSHTGANTDIPVLPSGRWLQIEILSTWGDPYYVGLNGVEIFDHRGELLRFQDPVAQVSACPESINVLEENTDDPRVPKNLVDGVNFTCDDFHMWLAPFTEGQQHYVLLEMDAQVAISMVRIWNYNKSRTHTCRGVRAARLILFDTFPANLVQGLPSGDSAGRLIFEGEIRQAPGLIGADSVELSNEVILFTQESDILQAIEANDEALRSLAREQEREDEETRTIVNSVHRSMELRRPRTSDAGSRTVEGSSKNQESDVSDRHFGKDGRPMTMATRGVRNDSARLRTSIDSWVAEEPQQKSPDGEKMNLRASDDRPLDDDVNAEDTLLHGRRMVLQLHSTWGDRNYIGLTQIEVLVGSRGTPIPLDVSNIDAKPRDLASLGYVGDPRTLDKLIDGEGTTCDDTHMWLVPLGDIVVPEILIEFKKAQYLYGLRIWNYNKSPEDTYRGAKQIVVILDGAVVSPKKTGFLLRKAPGVAEFDFGQLLRFPLAVERPGASCSFLSSSYSERVHYPFSVHSYKTPIVRQDYEAPLYPQGFILKIICWTTWGDPYYLGLNGFELYDFAGVRIAEKPEIITAAPFSVSELDNGVGGQQDTRTPDNLLSGLDKNTWEAHDAWLAPLASSLGNQQGNIIYVGFDTPVVLSMIKFWNYAKSPERGVKDMDIYLDDLHLFSGTLQKAPVADIHGGSSRFSKMHKVVEQFGQPVLFSANQAQVAAEKRYVSYCGAEEQDVLGINEGQVMQESRAMYRKPDPGAKGVVVDLECRPMTAVCRQ
ncbi:hypothetical protein PHYBOEH_000431 [Phytophthora boehmeriae]|uniref:KATNIP domain-containing protein n=1 Tax=Phytophthora boehmeriae TaxID=109152 RepID=A0A8T1X1K1_9STRA|nr:hypothetical protein PHYBOEH_000431 [Phytophthora boehmeriae]